MDSSRNTFSKEERLCGKNAISTLLAKGSFAKNGKISYCSAPNDAGLNRIMISVSKKFFKRAVKRNLLKRRIREAYRKQKHLLDGQNIDLLIMYRTKEILTYDEIYTGIGQILESLDKDAGQ